MEHIAAFLLAVSCSGDLGECRELPAPLPVYETVQDCNAELPAIRRIYEDASPNLFIRCFEVDPLLAEENAEIVWDVTQKEGLTAVVEPIGPDEVLVASSHERDEAERHIPR